MMRALLVTALILQASVAAQQRGPLTANPFDNDPLWRFHVGMEQYARAHQAIRESSSVAELVEARFRIGDQVGAMRAARGLLSASPADLARGLNAINTRDRFPRDGVPPIREELAAFVPEARARVERLSREDGVAAAVPLLSLEYELDRANEDADRQRVQALLTRYAGTPAAAEFEVSQVEGDRRSIDAEARLRRFRELASKYDRTT